MRFLLSLSLFCGFVICIPFEDLYTDQTNVAIRWSRLHFEIMRQPDFKFTPPIAGRALSVVQNTIYDIWSFYDTKALPTIDYDLSKRKGSQDDIDEAISVGAWRAIRHIYKDMPNYPFVEQETDELLEEITGLQNPTSRNENSPEGLGNLVADAMMEYCDEDGANNYGDKPFTRPSENGDTAFQDYTNYAPTNPPLVTDQFTSESDCAAINIDRWQPLTTPVSLDGSGSVTQEYYTPHMGDCRGFALKYGGQFRPRGPPVFGLNAEGRVSFEDQHNEVLDISSTLNDREKVISDFWLPTAEFGNPPSHSMFFAINALIAQNRDLADSVKLLMLVANSQFDAGIAAWDAKRHYDSSRPITAIRCMHTGKNIQAWVGPYQGIQTIDAGNWLPYQYINFVSPPFSEYVSGHSTFAMAGAVVMEKFFGEKWVGPNSVTWLAGESATEPKIDDPSDPLYIAGVTDQPNQGPNTVGFSPAEPITLTWETWRDGARESGISRLYGGVHIQDGNDDGLDLGDKVGEAVWKLANSLFNGQDPHSCDFNYDSDSFSSSSSSSYLSIPGITIFFLLIILF